MDVESPLVPRGQPAELVEQSDRLFRYTPQDTQAAAVRLALGAINVPMFLEVNTWLIHRTSFVV